MVTQQPSGHVASNRCSCCAVCDSNVEPWGEATVLGDVSVRYFRCPSCGFIQTEDPNWLDRAYASPITQQDLGMVSRNLELADRAEAAIRLCTDAGGRFLDYGGGYGLLVRLLRDRGLDFWLSDPHCRNLFAGPAETTTPERSCWEAVTAFEVLEHVVQPREEVLRLLSMTHTLICSTVLLPDPAPRPDAWHYYGLDHGQHISLYSLESLRRLAAQSGARVFSNGNNLHILTTSRTPAWRYRAALGRWGRRLRRWMPKRQALTLHDVETLRSSKA